MDANLADGTTSPSAAAADGILHPVVLGAIGLLLLNDHVLKSAYPGPLTGKISDVAGLVFFPFVLVGLWELCLLLARRWMAPGTTPVLVAVAATAIGFSAVKTLPAAADAFGWVLGVGQWLPAALASTLAGQSDGSPASASVVRDATDLLALPALAIPLVVGLARARRWNGRDLGHGVA